MPTTSYQYPKLKVESPNVKYWADEEGKVELESLYEYEHVKVFREPDAIKVSGGAIGGSSLKAAG